MYNIAICDDEISVCNKLENCIQKYLRGHYIKGNINVFYSGEAFCTYLDNGENIDLVFLDIELPKMNGVQVGRYLRNELKNELLDIVYISSKTGYALELFKNRPLDFIIKPVSYTHVEEILDVIIKRSGIKRHSFSWQKDNINYKISIHEIIYFQSDNKKIHMLLTSGEENVFIGKLNEVEQSLPETAFIKIHKSYLVNFDYVEQYSYEWIKLINGEILNISKSHRSDVRMKLMQREME